MINTGELYEYIVQKLREYETLMENKRVARAKTIPKRLELYLAKTGVTKDALARKLGVSRMQLFRWLYKHSIPGEEAMKRLEEMGIVEKIE